MMTTRSRILIVTGLSGAGRSTCLKILEDLEFEAVDNLPFPLLRRLLASDDAFERDLAIGMDTRTSGFDPAGLLELLDEMGRADNLTIELIFCDCSDRIIQQRYSETRRPHPMAPDRRITDGIAAERKLLASMHERADYLLDTSETTPRTLRDRLIAMFAGHGSETLAPTVMSFAFRHGLPSDADLVFDVRFLRNPHYDAELRHLTGLVDEVASFVRADPDFESFSSSLETLLLPLLPRYRSEGKSYLTIAFGCTGGQHRSVFMAEWLTSRLREAGFAAKTLHREIENKRISDAPQR